MKWIDLRIKSPNNSGVEVVVPKYPIIEITFNDEIPDDLFSGDLESLYHCTVLLRKVSENINTYDKNEPKHITLQVLKIGNVMELDKESRENKKDVIFKKRKILMELLDNSKRR